MYDDTRSLAVWAKTRIIVNRLVLLAAEDIQAGSIVSEAQVRALSVAEFPFAGPTLHSAAEIGGKVARRHIQAGQRLSIGMFEEAKDVLRGDIVQVRVIDGLATLSFDGIAASSGKKGDSILVRNAASGRNFRAVVEEKGKAVVRLASGD